MKDLIKSLALACGITTMSGLAQTQAPPAAAADTQPSGRIAFASTVHDFGKLRAGQSLKCSFGFTNTGNATLVISNVHLDCGCVVVKDWSRRVEPGQSGVIPVQLDTAETWPGGPISKAVKVDSSDGLHPSVRLEIKGIIWKPVDVIPHYVALNIAADSPASASTTVRIVNNTDTPLFLSPPQLDSPAFAAELRTNQAGKEYQLVVTAKPPFAPGTRQSEVRLQTSLTSAPEVKVMILATSQPALVVMPPQIILPRPPLGRRATPTLTIRNNTPSALRLSEPAFTVKGVDFLIREAVPGQVFTVAFTFPQDFSLAQATQAEFTVRTSDPRFPMIQVPIRQVSDALQPKRDKPQAAPGDASSPATNR